jgi:DNA-binding NtrC family response regulator
VSHSNSVVSIARFYEKVSQAKILVVGDVGDTGFVQLVEGLEKSSFNCVVVDCHNRVTETMLADAVLVFVFVGKGEAALQHLQLESMVHHASGVNVIPIVGYEDQDNVVSLMEIGCMDYLLAPFSASQLAALLQRQKAVADAQGTFVSCSPAGRRLLAMSQRVAATRAPILLTGETGTGKEMIARYIHQIGTGNKGPFVAINCAAIPEQMLESLLFGHERGAFTGAQSAQSGKFELANGGTLLLDEVGELPLGLQAKLLRVLQERCVERLGASKSIKLDVRIIAATNRDLNLEVAQGRFRADLMFRLDVLPLHITPLRERQEDVLPLARRFIAQYAPQEHTDCLLTEAACVALLHHTWPGNVRELENKLQRALVLRNGLFIQPRDLNLPVPAGSMRSDSVPATDSPEGKAALRATGKWAEYQHVIDTIRKFGGHKAKAAYSLGMTPRALRYRLTAMRELGLQLPTF